MLMRAFAISASCCGYHAEDDQWCCCKRIVTDKCLWRKNGEMLLDAAEHQNFWCSTKKSYQKLGTKALLSIQVPAFSPTYLC